MFVPLIANRPQRTTLLIER